MIYCPAKRPFRTRKGPIFANFILADEINRAPSKVQSALLEAMQERQVTIGDHTYPLPGCSWSWPRRTRSSRKARIRCPRRRSTASCSRWDHYPEADEEQKVLDMALDDTARPIKPVLQPAEVSPCRTWSR